MATYLVSRVSRTSNAANIRQIAKILDVGKNNIGRAPVVRILVVLSTALGSNMSRETCVDHNVLLAGVLINAKSSNDEESMTKVKFMREPSELCMQLGKRESILGDVWQGQVQR